MASVRLEDQVWTDPRFVMLGKLYGASHFDAIARVAMIWNYCTEKKIYSLSEALIETLSCVQNFSEFLVNKEVSLAVFDQETGLYRVKGTKGRVEWLARLRKNGKKGGRPKKTRTKPDDNQMVTQNVTRSEPGANPLVPVPVPVPTTVLINNNNTDTEIEVSASRNGLTPVPQPSLFPIQKKSKFSDDTRSKMRAFIATYSSAYHERYGAPPEGIRDKALVGKIGHWIESVSEQRAVELAQVYLQIDYRPINESCHDLWKFFFHLNRIGNALNTGSDPSGIDWKKVFG
jgi:hypothetical protein